MPDCRDGVAFADASRSSCLFRNIGAPGNVDLLVTRGLRLCSFVIQTSRAKRSARVLMSRYTRVRLWRAATSVLLPTATEVAENVEDMMAEMSGAQKQT